MLSNRFFLLLVLFALALAGPLACGNDDDDDDTGADDDDVVHVDETPGCDPLVAAFCAWPAPSMYYTSEDSDSPTGYRVALTEEILPVEMDNKPGFLARFNAADGFSPASPFVTLFPDAFIDTATLPNVLDLEAGMSANASVQVFVRETGERLPVWAEVDLHGQTPDQQPLIVRPMKAVPFGHTAVIAITDSLRFEDGSTPTTPTAFAALRDGQPTDSGTIEARRDEFEALFGFLEEQGIERDSLLLAWQAPIASQSFARSEMPQVVEKAVEVFDAVDFVEYEITACYADNEADRQAFGCEAQEDENTPLIDETWRRVYGTVQLPGFLTAENYIEYDEDGKPIVQEDFTAEFVLNIPDSLKDAGPGTAPFVTFGHGLFSEPAAYVADDDNSEGQMVLSDRLGMPFIGTRWTGLSSTDMGAAAELVLDVGSSFVLPAKLSQGMANQVLIAPFVINALKDDPLLQTADGMGSLIDTGHRFYTGISQGGIFGTTFMAMSPYVKTGVLHVPASGYTHLLPHSGEFGTFQALLDSFLPDYNDQQLFFILAQRLFDVGDPINYIDAIEDDPMTELGKKNCLWQCSEGDTLAPWYGCDMMMRTGGFPQAAPVYRDILGVDTIETPTEPGTSALQYYDPQLGVPPTENDNVYDSGAHKALRRNDEVHFQTMDYFDLEEPGRVVNHCGGPCIIDPVPVNP